MALDTAKATAYLRDLTAKFDSAVLAATPLYPRFALTVPSDGAYEKYGWLGDMPGVREWLGERKYHELRGASYEIANKDWESSLNIPKNDLEDDRMALYPNLMENLAAEAAYHPDELFFNLLVNGESNTCFDGQFFFDTDHSWGDSGSQSNDLSHTVVSTSSVTVAEFKAAFRKAVAAILGFKNDRGKPFQRPTAARLSDLTIVVPLALRDVAIESVEAALVGGGNTNVVIDKPEIIAVPALPSDVKFYVLRTGQVMPPVVFQARKPLERQIADLTDNKVKDVKFLTNARYNMGYLAWWNACLVTLST